MTTASTNTTIAQTSNATFQAWVNEIFTNVVTVCGLSQTSDTGQMAVPCVTAAPSSAGQQVGYYVLAFNDPLQASAPVYIRMDFGAGNNGVTTPAFWITVGTSTNGAGTIGGTALPQVASFANEGPVSPTTNYVSRFCYNTAQGFLGVAFKFGAANATYPATPIAGFAIFRTVNATGAPTADGVLVFTCSTTVNGSTVQGDMLAIDYNDSAHYLNTAPYTQAIAWGYIPFSPLGTLQGTSGQVFPVFQWNGKVGSLSSYGITNALALCCFNDISLNSTVNLTILGSLSLTYMQVGGLTSISSATNLSYNIGTTAGNYGLLMLWQ